MCIPNHNKKTHPRREFPERGSVGIGGPSEGGGSPNDMKGIWGRFGWTTTVGLERK